MAIRKVISRSITDGTIAQADLADGVGGSNVKLYSVTPQTVSGASGVSVVIIGEGFVATPTVHFVSAATGTQTAAGSVTFNNATKLTVTTPQLTAADEPWSIKVTNSNGQSASIESILDAGSAPAWSTSAGQIGSDTVQGNSFSQTVAATDPDGQSITYSESGTDVLTGSGSGKLNFTLNSSSGAITGTMPSLSSDTTFNFTLGASDGVNLSTRNFNIVGKAGTPTVNYIYGGVVACRYQATGHSSAASGYAGQTVQFGIVNADQTSGYVNHGAANYGGSATQTQNSSGYSGSHSGSSSQGSGEIFTSQGNEDGHYYARCQGSGATGVGISRGWYWGRMYIPDDHDRMRIEFYAGSYSSNQSSTGGDIEFRFKSSISRYAYGFNGTDVTGNASPASGGLARLGGGSSYGGKSTGTRQFDANISASTINGSNHQFAFYASGGQYSDSQVQLYRVATYNSAIGLA
tara:strand:- start:2613 stop:4001 length:1389 start_codon:yes stop_codon:yes gene_type:complete